ncbi:MAG TPA: peptidoglycan DD-metalloendopeptidase family protein [Candidatus Limnocylindrales bacterium]|nr:peptidoglycan DD-metalloendopeptidase family protein [Candidatus Limnocylindrales bacterium]
MSDAAKKTFLIKIIPPSGYSVYRLAFTRRHLATAGIALLLASLALVGIHSWQLRNAEANVRELQAVTTEQQTKLQSIDKQADALANQLKAVQRENAEIKRLIGADRGGKKQHAMLAPAGPARPADFAAVQQRLRTLARASAATSDDAKQLQSVAMRVLNLRRMASLARERMIASIPSLNPVGGGIAAGFGWRTNPWPEFHKGVDLEANYGDLVRAAAAGTVASAGWDGGFGIKVDIDHGNGYHTWYAHLSRVAVTAGQRVTKGAPIAYVGSTGESTGPHLHYQVMYEGNPVDPQPFLHGVPEKVLATLPDSPGV